MIKNKTSIKRVVLLNKIDLADNKETKKWIKGWPSSDDKTLVYLLDDKEEKNEE